MALEVGKWKKGSRSNGSGGNNCVEVSRDDDGCVVVRDSKLNGIDGQPVHCFSPAEWTAFVESAKLGEFDL